ncbi:MAG TPA: PilZ domain-containing protein [Nitrospiraceae bacterium]|nr:PilZ domain-containing protein [Nitrospiraceae bacterium]
MQPRCPACQSTYVRRAHRVGVFEQLLSLFYVYPFRCQLCSVRFTSLQWGVRYARQEDLRQYERIGVQFPVQFSNARTNGKGVVTDVSVADCAIETSLPLKQGESLKLELYAKSGRPPIIVEKAVIRSVRKGAIGVQFTEVSDADKARLNRLVSDMVGVFVAPLPRSPAAAGPMATTEGARR